MNSKRYAIFSVLFLFVLSVLAMCKQLGSQGYYSCFVSDTYQYTSWAWQFIEGLREGVAYPRWLPLNFWGYGSPTFIIYPPLVFYLVAVLNIFTHSIIVAMNLVKAISLFITAVGIFFFVREIYPERVSLIAGSFYTVFPFYIFNIYIGGGFTSTVSFMWFPLIMLFAFKYIKSGRCMYVVYSGACYGGLILTHLINAYIFTFIVTAFIIYMSITKKKPKCLLCLPFIILTGIALSAAYLLPLIYEKHFIDFQSVAKNFPLSDFFILPKHTDKFYARFFWKDYYSVYLSYVILFFVIVIIMLFKTVKSKHLRSLENANIMNIFFLGVSFFSMFLLFGPSIVIWKAIPFFKYSGIPIRWLNITAFSVVFLSAAGFYLISVTNISKIKQYFMLSAIFLLCLLPDYKYTNSACIFSSQDLFPARAINWLPEHVPKGVDLGRIDKNEAIWQPVVIQGGEGSAEVMLWQSAERIVEIQALEQITLRIRTFYFPGWKAYVDGTQKEIKTEEDVGAMLIEIPKGRHELVLRFEDTPVRYYAKLLSLVSLVIVVVLVLFSKRKKRNTNSHI